MLLYVGWTQITSINTSTAQLEPLYSTLCNHQFTRGTDRDWLQLKKFAVCTNKQAEIHSTLPPPELVGKQTQAGVHIPTHALHGCHTRRVRATGGRPGGRTEAPPQIGPVAIATKWGLNNNVCCVSRAYGGGFFWHPKLSRWCSPPTVNHIPAKWWQLETISDLDVSVCAWCHSGLSRCHTISMSKFGNTQTHMDITNPKVIVWELCRSLRVLFQVVCFPTHRNCVCVLHDPKKKLKYYAAKCRNGSEKQREKERKTKGGVIGEKNKAAEKQSCVCETLGNKKLQATYYTLILNQCGLTVWLNHTSVKTHVW